MVRRCLLLNILRPAANLGQDLPVLFHQVVLHLGRSHFRTRVAHLWRSSFVCGVGYWESRGRSRSIWYFQWRPDHHCIFCAFRETPRLHGYVTSEPVVNG